jgi:hypothetical protein
MNDHKQTTDELRKSWSYEFSEWKLSALPVELIHSQDDSESYEMDRQHVFKLENGRYAYISEQGCSCYEYSDAEVCEYPTKEEAMSRVTMRRYV